MVRDSHEPYPPKTLFVDHHRFSPNPTVRTNEKITHHPKPSLSLKTLSQTVITCAVGWGPKAGPLGSKLFAPLRMSNTILINTARKQLVLLDASSAQLLPSLPTTRPTDGGVGAAVDSFHAAYNLCAALRDHRELPVVSFSTLLTLLEPMIQPQRQTPEGETVEIQAWDAAAASLEQPTLGYLYLLVYLKTADVILRTTTLGDRIGYYSAVLGLRTALGLYSVQRLPGTAWRGVRGFLGHPAELLFVARGLTRDVSAFTRDFSAFMRATATRVATHVAARDVSALARDVAVLARALSRFGQRVYRSCFREAEATARQNREALIALQTENVSKLGALMTTMSPDLALAVARLEYLLTFQSLEALGALQTTAEDANVAIALNAIIETAVPRLRLRAAVVERATAPPNLLARTWPVLTLGALYGPAIAMSAVTNGPAIAAWLHLNVVETIIGFGRNWILEPVQNILATIRHDETSRIAIASLSSLESDLDSLQRMVVSYVVDLNPSADVAQIQLLVQNGDLTPLMKDYELQLRAPLRGVLNGHLIRSLLIQIQKTKVDGGMVVTGIDKLLKSQELVFGLVAASPAAVFLVWAATRVNNYFRRGAVLSAQPHRVTASERLNNIERLLGNYAQLDRYYTEGLLLVDLRQLRKSGLKLVPTKRRAEWIRDVGDMGDVEVPVEVRLASVRRVWRVWGGYL